MRARFEFSNFTASLEIIVKLNYCKYHFLLLALCIAGFAQAQTLNPPSLRCLSVSPAGDVTLSWVIPPDPFGIFNNYSIYSSPTPSGPFSLAFATTGYFTTSITDFGAGADNSSFYYYVITTYDNGSGIQSSFPSDTLQSIFINLIPGPSQATINWNPIHVGELPTSLGKYYIYRKSTISPWTLIDSTLYGNETYTETIGVCKDSMYYRVEIGDSMPCTSVSSIASELIGDDTPPVVPVIDSVSVDPLTGNVLIGWQPSISTDVEKYIIAYNHPLNNWLLIDSVDATVTAYLDNGGTSGADPTQRSEQYGIAAHDSCWWGAPNPSPNTSSTGILHRTIYLEGTMDQCKREINLSWNQYEQWQGGINEYKIFVSKDGGISWNLIGSKAPGETTFKHSNLTPNDNYCYIVRAVANAGARTSTSNKLCMTMYVPQQPAVHYLTHVSVTDGNMVEITFLVDLNAAVLYYDIKRADGLDTTFESIGQVFPSNSAIITFIDESAKADEQSYFYRVDVIDVCSKTVMTSAMCRTMYAKSEADSDALENTVNWNSYQDWDVFGNGVGYYNIYRSFTGFKADAELLTTLTSSQNDYLDNITDEYESGGKFCYYIEAVEAPGNTLNFQETSHSNLVCVTIDPRIFIPTAFTPDGDGLNDEFIPYGAFVDNSDYYFAVFDRWGHRIFITTDINKGWDASYGGSKVGQGVYVYHVIFTDADGNKIERRGAVTVVR